MSGHGEKLTRKQEQAIAALLLAETLEQAATAAGIGSATLRRWLATPEFAEAYRAARRQAVEQATARLQRAAGEAVETLRALLGPEATPAVRLGAAKAVLELAYRAVEVEDLERRIEALERSEERAAGLSSGSPAGWPAGRNGTGRPAGRPGRPLGGGVRG